MCFSFANIIKPTSKCLLFFVLQAYLQYGIPKNSLKRISLILKVRIASILSINQNKILQLLLSFSCCTFQAAYNIGGHIISVDMIQSSILGCRLPRSGQVSIMLKLRLSSQILCNQCVYTQSVSD